MIAGRAGSYRYNPKRSRRLSPESHSPMQSRPLGGSSLSLPVITFGAYPIGGWSWGGADPERARQTLRAAIDAGITAIDTAPIYGFGLSEELVGEVCQGRDDVLLLTKVGLNWIDRQGPLAFETRDPAGRLVRVHRNSRPASIRREVQASLQRLRRERIDLIQVHAPDPSTPIAETMGELAALRDEGLVREIGVSNYDSRQLEEARAALGATPLASVQPPYSLLQRGIEEDVLPYALEHGIGVLAYSPLDQGSLCGKFCTGTALPPADGRNKRPTFMPENMRRICALLDEVVTPIAEAHEISLAQTVLAWTAARPGITTLLVGARRPQQAIENAAAGAIELTTDEHERIDQAFRGLELKAMSPPSLLNRIRGKLHKLRHRRM